MQGNARERDRLVSSREMRVASSRGVRGRKRKTRLDSSLTIGRPDRPGTRVNGDVAGRSRGGDAARPSPLLLLFLSLLQQPLLLSLLLLLLLLSPLKQSLSLLSLHGPDGMLLELIEMPGDLTVQLLGYDADAAEEGPEHVELLREQFDPFLQEIVVFHQQLDLLLGLP